ncbi:MAG TPA: hypothetical protein VLI92_01755 [Candidatus Saccharimonadales bacterium]|nr:hypothetical protein [Candidatus Saccharimonadales bacterium]
MSGGSNGLHELKLQVMNRGVTVFLQVMEGSLRGYFLTLYGDRGSFISSFVGATQWTLTKDNAQELVIKILKEVESSFPGSVVSNWGTLNSAHTELEKVTKQ